MQKLFGFMLGALLLTAGLIYTHPVAAETCPDAPTGLAVTTGNGQRYMTWDRYDFTECGDGSESTYRYKIQVKTLSGELVQSIKVTRSDDSDTPGRRSQLDLSVLGNNELLKFRVRAVGDAGSKSLSSSYYQFTTRAAAPSDVEFALGSQTDELWDGTVSWDPIKASEAGDFLHYKVKIIQRAYEPSVEGNHYNWTITSTTILDDTTTDGDATVDQYVLDETLLQDYYDTATASPYTRYKYYVSVRAYYTDPTDSEAKTHSVSAKNNFGIIDDAVSYKVNYSQI